MPRQVRAFAQAARFIVTLIATDYDRVLTRVEMALTRLEPSLQELPDANLVEREIDVRDYLNP